MKTYGGAAVYTHVFLSSALFGGERSASRLDRFTPGAHWIEGWVGPEPVWKTWRSENPSTYRDPNSDPSVVQQNAYYFNTVTSMSKQAISKYLLVLQFLACLK
jgi:hypothetical protein